jgi:hypothetical protein
MKEIKLTQGYTTQVDDDMYDYLMQWKWYAHKEGPFVYATRTKCKGNGDEGNRGLVKMHRVIMNTTDGMQVDHVDHDTLNNQKSNLRNCTLQENQWNREPIKGKKLPKGISMFRGKQYRARITVDYVEHHLGHFDTIEPAIEAYRKASEFYFGDFRYKND